MVDILFPYCERSLAYGMIGGGFGSCSCSWFVFYEARLVVELWESSLFGCEGNPRVLIKKIVLGGFLVVLYLQV